MKQIPQAQEYSPARQARSLLRALRKHPQRQAQRWESSIRWRRYTPLALEWGSPVSPPGAGSRSSTGPSADPPGAEWRSPGLQVESSTGSVASATAFRNLRTLETCRKVKRLRHSVPGDIPWKPYLCGYYRSGGRGANTFRVKIVQLNRLKRRNALPCGVRKAHMRGTETARQLCAKQHRHIRRGCGWVWINLQHNRTRHDAPLTNVTRKKTEKEVQLPFRMGTKIGQLVSGSQCFVLV